MCPVARKLKHGYNDTVSAQTGYRVWDFIPIDVQPTPAIWLHLAKMKMVTATWQIRHLFIANVWWLSRLLLCGPAVTLSNCFASVAANSDQLKGKETWEPSLSPLCFIEVGGLVSRCQTHASSRLCSLLTVKRHDAHITQVHMQISYLVLFSNKQPVTFKGPVCEI